MSINSLLTNQPLLNGLKEIIGDGYVLPVASETVLGGVKIDGTSILINNGVISAVGGGSGNTSLWADYKAVADVDMDEKDIINLENITAQGYVATNTLQSSDGGLVSIAVLNDLDMSGKSILGANSIITQSLSSPNTALSITSSQVLTLFSADNISIETDSVGKDNNKLEFSNLGNLTFTNGTQNITNELGTTTSKNFTLTEGQGGKIVFPDLTEMTTAATAPANWSTIAAIQSVNMDGNMMLNVGNIEMNEGSITNLSQLINYNDLGISVTGNNIVNIASNTDSFSSLLGISSQLILSRDGCYLNVYSNGVLSKAAILDLLGNFTVPSLVINGTGAGITFPDTTVQSSGVQKFLGLMESGTTSFDITVANVNALSTIVVATWLGTETPVGILSATIGVDTITIHSTVAPLLSTNVSVIYFI